MSFALCTEPEAINKAGINANTTFVASTATIAAWSDQVEGTINSITRFDWVADIGNVNANFIGILADTASDLIAMKIVSNDLSGYNKTLNGTTLLDILNNNSQRNIEILRVKLNTEKITPTR